VLIWRRYDMTIRGLVRAPLAMQSTHRGRSKISAVMSAASAGIGSAFRVRGSTTPDAPESQRRAANSKSQGAGMVSVSSFRATDTAARNLGGLAARLGYSANLRGT
jgi:hypothetical protein